MIFWFRLNMQHIVFLLYFIMIPALQFGHPNMGHAGKTHTPDIYIVKYGDTLGRIAMRYNVSVEELRKWNNLYNNRIYRGQHLKLWPVTLPMWYMVRSGDTLSEIAASFGLSISSLQKLNNISGERIYPGQRLILSLVQPHTVRKDDTLWGISQHYGISVQHLKKLNNLKTSTITPGLVLRIMDPPQQMPPTEEPYEYIIKKGDSLSTVAHRFDVGLSLLRQLNHLKGDRIYPGQKLQLRPSSLDEAAHIVRPGETLSSISLKYNIKIARLSEINGLENSRIRVGQKLHLKAAPAASLIVERGDALWEIARAYGMTVKELKKLNSLDTDRIYPGQNLKLNATHSEHLGTYIVRKGDYLETIARLHQMSVSELRQVNSLKTAVIHPGEELKVKPLLIRGREWLKISEIHWENLSVSLEGMKKFQTGNGPYYHTRPEATLQKHAEYFEIFNRSPLQNYRKARKLWKAFEREVSRHGRLSNTLNGWHFVLDPGHGGLDPGAVVETLDGNGNKVHVVEDEYVYDIALRVYVLLRLHGAEATMTLLSPNHLIRHSNPPVQTFVNEKNEVFNSYELNKTNRWKDWPNGGSSRNLESRVIIARNAFKNVPENRRIFLSFHADIDPNSPEAPMVLYYERRDGKTLDLISKNFSRTLLPALGAGAHARGQYLGVLRNNPASVKVLLELRNLAYNDHAWAIRFEQLRNRDAEKVVKGILDYVSLQTRKS